MSNLVVTLFDCQSGHGAPGDSKNLGRGATFWFCVDGNSDDTKTIVIEKFLFQHTQYYEQVEKFLFPHASREYLLFISFLLVANLYKSPLYKPIKNFLNSPQFAHLYDNFYKQLFPILEPISP